MGLGKIKSKIEIEYYSVAEFERITRLISKVK